MECYTFIRGTNFVCVAVGSNPQWLGHFVSVLSALCHPELYMVPIINMKLCNLDGGTELVKAGPLRMFAASKFENPPVRYLTTHQLTHYCNNVHTF
jgi:hypothetical protein